MRPVPERSDAQGTATTPLPGRDLTRRTALAASAAGLAGITSTLLPTAASASSDEVPLLAASTLRLYLDAGLTDSYPGTGTTWTDLSGNDKHATLVGSPTFFSAGTGSHLRFDGLGGTTPNGQHAEAPWLGVVLSTWTVEVWARLTDTLANRLTALVTDRINAAGLNFHIGTVGVGANPTLGAGFFSGDWRLTPGATVSAAGGAAPSVDRWHHHVATYSDGTIRQYLDGVEIGTAAAAQAQTSSQQGIRIARRWDDATNQDYSNYAPVDIGLVRIHDAAMTAAQVVAYRDATKGRYGL